MDNFSVRQKQESSFSLTSTTPVEKKPKKVFSKKTSLSIRESLEGFQKGQIRKKDAFKTKNIEKYKGDERLCRIKKEAFTLIDSTLESIIEGNEIKSNIKDIEKLCKKYHSTYTGKFAPQIKKTKDISKSSSSHHYTVKKDSHDKINGLQEISVKKAPKSVGKSIQTVKDKIKDIRSRDVLNGNFKTLFPGNDNSLNNLLILGPYGTGKTALIRELAYNKNIVTVQAQASDLLSMWYGVAEQNLKILFEHAYKIHVETGKKVFVLVDEFDQIMNMSKSSGGNQGEIIQKEMQMLLDGLKEYAGVHLVGLSNEPQAIPPAIIRRMDTVVTDKLSQKEKIELIHSRFKNIAISEDFQSFLEGFSQNIDYESLDAKVAVWYLLHKKTDGKEVKKGFGSLNPSEKSFLYWEFISEIGLNVSEDELFEKDISNNKNITSMGEDEKDAFKYLLASTPKILTSVCQRAFEIFLERKAKDFGEKEMKKLNKRLGKIKGKEKRKSFIEEHSLEIQFSDFTQAAKDVFDNPTILNQIAKNEEFYDYLSSIGLMSINN